MNLRGDLNIQTITFHLLSDPLTWTPACSIRRWILFFLTLSWQYGCVIVFYIGLFCPSTKEMGIIEAECEFARNTEHTLVHELGLTNSVNLIRGL